jgi:hypothetical protein
MTEQDPSTRIRLNVISEVAFEQGEARPIHMFRPGTFTDMNGREASFSDADVQHIVAKFNANKRRKPPITEQHDFGRAIGRVVDVWADTDGNLFGMPKWNADGRKLLENEIYDGFSCELDRATGGWALIGGSLTNYPAVDGLEPVTLAAPPIPVSLPNQSEDTRAADIPPLAPPASRPARVDIQTTIKENTRMPEEIQDGAEAPALPPITPPTFNAADPAVTAQVNAVVAQMTAQFEQQRQIVLEQAQAQFQRQMAEMQAQQTVRTWAQHASTPTINRQHAVPQSADELYGLAMEMSAAPRQKFMAMIDRLNETGLASFEEIGSSNEGEARDDKALFDDKVSAKVSMGMGRAAAIQAVAKEFPDLYTAQTVAKKGGR